MNDRIELRGIRVFGRHGANPGERDVPQPFDIDVAAELDLRAARAGDALADTLDYDALHRRICGIVRDTSYALLERLGDDILGAIFADGRVERAQVSIGKPRLLAGATPVVTVHGTRAEIGIGANLGAADATVRYAIQTLERLGRVAAASSLYRTPAWGVTDQPDFINAAVTLETDLAPYDLLKALKALEAEIGRVPTFRWGPRTIDLDILDYDGVRLDDPALTIPHARLRERAFALVPLAEIAPAYAALRDALPAAERTAVQRLEFS